MDVSGKQEVYSDFSNQLAELSLVCPQAFVNPETCHDN